LNQDLLNVFIQDYRVILMDSIVATGAAALMAVRVLLDHDVAEENISLGIFSAFLSLNSLLI
jgi:uridine kinase